ncbi:MAG: ATP-binding protein [Cyanobacteriota bacterium]|nr:ATP-binding protein [Cyanobacteriota bacterium]
MELWSEGGLPSGLLPDALKREHASRPRNLLIADVVLHRGLIERWGRGTQVIVEECQRAGCRRIGCAAHHQRSKTPEHQPLASARA